MQFHSFRFAFNFSVANEPDTDRVMNSATSFSEQHRCPAEYRNSLYHVVSAVSASRSLYINAIRTNMQNCACIHTYMHAMHEENRAGADKKKSKRHVSSREYKPFVVFRKQSSVLFKRFARNILSRILF